MSEESRKQAAATMKVGTSHYVATAALGVIGGAAALFTYISPTFEVPGVFNVLMLVAVACLVVSIILGGRGADDITADVADNNWTLDSGGSAFNLQALLTLLGLVLVLVATGFGASSERQGADLGDRVDVVEKRVEELRARVEEQSQVLKRVDLERAEAEGKQK
jgi:uncharacterized membrane protein